VPNGLPRACDTPRTAYDEKLAHRLRALVQAEEGITEMRMLCRKAGHAGPAAKPVAAKQRILELTASTSLDPEEIAGRVGAKPGWVKHVIKTSQPA
jgi:hypothetical protein